MLGEPTAMRDPARLLMQKLTGLDRLVRQSGYYDLALEALKSFHDKQLLTEN